MLDAIRRTILHPALALLPETLSGREAQVLLLASGLAASGFQTRRMPVARAGVTGGPCPTG